MDSSSDTHPTQPKTKKHDDANALASNKHNHLQYGRSLENRDTSRWSRLVFLIDNSSTGQLWIAIPKLCLFSLMAEALAISEALCHAHSLGYSKIWLRSDSETLIRALKSITQPMTLYGVLSDIDYLSSLFDFCFFSFIPRSQNGLADNLAKTCLQNTVNFWV